MNGEYPPIVAFFMHQCADGSTIRARCFQLESGVEWRFEGGPGRADELLLYAVPAMFASLKKVDAAAKDTPLP